MAKTRTMELSAKEYNAVMMAVAFFNDRLYQGQFEMTDAHKRHLKKVFERQEQLDHG